MTEPQQRPSRRLSRPATLAIAAAALLGFGGAIGAVTVAETRPSVTMAPATPVAIRSLTNGIVTVRGRVAETYGNKFVLADGSGRALVDTGRQGEDTALVAAGQQVTVQGRFEHGFVHAAFLVGADGKVQALGPIDGPPHHRRPHDDRGAAPAPAPAGAPSAPSDAPKPPAAAPATGA